MKMPPTEEELQQKANQRKRRDFDAWMNEPMTRMCLSTIPPAERPEALELLLKSAFDKGFTSGQSEILASFVEHMVAKPRRE